MARRPRQATPEERALWAKVAATVDPLRKPDLPSKPDRTPASAAEVAAPPPPATPAKRRARKPAAPPAGPAATVYTPPLALRPAGKTGATPFGEMDRRSLEKFRRGRFVIDSRLDLHGMTQAQAHTALRAFVLDNHRRGRRKLLVITGKGGGGLADPLAPPKGVLRGRLQQWLSEPDLKPLVLRLEQARPDHGGAGAFYLLLRRVREG